MEATVVSRRDASILRRVTLSESPQIPPKCCSYSTDGTGFPYWHGVSVIFKKHGYVNVHMFIDSRHLTPAWKAQYENLEFPFPAQANIDRVISDAGNLVADSASGSLQVLLRSTHRGDVPRKTLGPQRLKTWYESGLKRGSKKRKYSCSLCGSQEHIAKHCPLRQIDEDEQIDEDDNNNSDSDTNEDDR